MNEYKKEQEWIGKKCKIFIRNLSTNEWIGKEMPIFVNNLFKRVIVYNATILSIEPPFVTILDRYNDKIIINLNSINPSERAIVYTATILSFEPPFVTILDRDNNKITINVNDIIQIKEADS